MEIPMMAQSFIHQMHEKLGIEPKTLFYKMSD